MLQIRCCAININRPNYSQILCGPYQFIHNPYYSKIVGEKRESLIQASSFCAIQRKALFFQSILLCKVTVTTYLSIEYTNMIRNVIRPQQEISYVHVYKSIRIFLITFYIYTFTNHTIHREIHIHFIYCFLSFSIPLLPLLLILPFSHFNLHLATTS